MTSTHISGISMLNILMSTLTAVFSILDTLISTLNKTASALVSVISILDTLTSPLKDLRSYLLHLFLSLQLTRTLLLKYVW